MTGFTIGRRWTHSKASEEFVEVVFDYGTYGRFEWSVPIQYPRAGLELETDTEIAAHVAAVYDAAHPDRHSEWRNEQLTYWANSRSPVTKPIFDALAQGFDWLSYSDLSASSNPARRIQDLKEMGYTIATRRLAGRPYEFMLLPLPRSGETGYEWWSGALRTRIVRVLASFDAYEGRTGNPKHLLPDHKFPEVRWDANTRRETLDHLDEADIRRDFQLISNQRNQQKREACRACFQTSIRPYPFGIPFYYAGGSQWPADVPRRGKAAEAGCVGCGWYDLQAWRQALIARLGTTSVSA